LESEISALESHSEVLGKAEKKLCQQLEKKVSREEKLRNKLEGLEEIINRKNEILRHNLARHPNHISYLSSEPSRLRPSLSSSTSAISSNKKKKARNLRFATQGKYNPGPYTSRTAWRQEQQIKHTKVGQVLRRSRSMEDIRAGSRKEAGLIVHSSKTRSGTFIGGSLASLPLLGLSKNKSKNDRKFEKETPAENEGGGSVLTESGDDRNDSRDYGSGDLVSSCKNSNAVDDLSLGVGDGDVWVKTHSNRSSGANSVDGDSTGHSLDSDRQESYSVPSSPTFSRKKKSTIRLKKKLSSNSFRIKEMKRNNEINVNTENSSDENLETESFPFSPTLSRKKSNSFILKKFAASKGHSFRAKKSSSTRSNISLRENHEEFIKRNYTFSGDDDSERQYESFSVPSSPTYRRRNNTFNLQNSTKNSFGAKKSHTRSKSNTITTTMFSKNKELDLNLPIGGGLLYQLQQEHQEQHQANKQRTNSGSSGNSLEGIDDKHSNPNPSPTKNQYESYSVPSSPIFSQRKSNMMMGTKTSPTKNKSNTLNLKKLSARGKSPSFGAKKTGLFRSSSNLPQQEQQEQQESDMFESDSESGDSYYDNRPAHNSPSPKKKVMQSGSLIKKMLSSSGRDKKKTERELLAEKIAEWKENTATKRTQDPNLTDEYLKEKHTNETNDEKEEKSKKEKGKRNEGKDKKVVKKKTSKEKKNNPEENDVDSKQIEKETLTLQKDVELEETLKPLKDTEMKEKNVKKRTEENDVDSKQIEKETLTLQKDVEVKQTEKEKKAVKMKTLKEKKNRLEESNVDSQLSKVIKKKNKEKKNKNEVNDNLEQSQAEKEDSKPQNDVEVKQAEKDKKAVKKKGKT